jgi:predicted transcriptional regulator
LGEGPFRFDDGVTPDKDNILVPIDLENVIIEGARRIREAGELNMVVEDLNSALRFPEDAKKKFTGVHLSVDEWKVVSYVNPKNTVAQIMKQLNMSEIEIKRVVYALNQAGLVEIVKPQAGSAAAANPSRSRAAARRSRQAPVQKKVVNKLIEKLKSM